MKLQVPWCSRQTAQTSSAFSLVEIGNSQISASLCPRLRAGWNSKPTMIICCCLMSCQNMKNRCYALIEIQVRQSLQKSVQIMLSASVRLTDSSICPITEKGWSLNRRHYFAVISVLVFLFYVFFFPIFFFYPKRKAIEFSVFKCMTRQGSSWTIALPRHMGLRLTPLIKSFID